jgi:hypothetical protein
VESNWVHSALRPPIGLLCQPRVIMMMEKLVEWWLTGETEVLGKNLPQCRFVHQKPHMPDRTRTRAAAVGSQRLTTWAMARPELEVLTPVFMKSTIFWDITPCSPLKVNHVESVRYIRPVGEILCCLMTRVLIHFALPYLMFLDMPNSDWEKSYTWWI